MDNLLIVHHQNFLNIFVSCLSALTKKQRLTISRSVDCSSPYVIIVTTATTDGGILIFSGRRTYLHRNVKCWPILAILLKGAGYFPSTSQSKGDNLVLTPPSVWNFYQIVSQIWAKTAIFHVILTFFDIFHRLWPYLCFKREILGFFEQATHRRPGDEAFFYFRVHCWWLGMDKKWSILDQKWPHMAGLSMSQSGPKWCMWKRVQNGQPNCFWRFRTLVDPPGHTSFYDIIEHLNKTR